MVVNKDIIKITNKINVNYVKIIAKLVKILKEIYAQVAKKINFYIRMTV